MHGKSKKGKGTPADDFDDIIAHATHLNASIATTSSSSTNSIGKRSGSINANIDSSSSSSSQVPPTDEDSDEIITQLCIAGDIVRLRRHLGRPGRRIGALPMRHAALHVKLHIVRCLVEEYDADINEPYDNGLTPLFAAAQNGHLSLVWCMGKKLGADVNKAGYDGGTPLYVAAQNGDLGVVLCLVKELGADVNQTINNDGFTLLHLAAQTNNLDVLRCLVECGASSSVAMTDTISNEYCQSSNE
jgi:ankyrin repeat protein